MQFSLLPLTITLSTLLTLTLTTPIASPFTPGTLPSGIKNYMASVAKMSSTLKHIAPLCSSFSNITMHAGSLPPVSDGLSLWHIAVGRGTQNYTCPAEKGASAAPVALGAVAKMYNLTCAAGYYGSESVNTFTDAVALQDKDKNFALRLLQSGNHYFSDMGAGSKAPVFNLNMGDPATNYGIVFVGKDANVTAPPTAAKAHDGSAAVPWLKLVALSTLPPPAILRPEDAAPAIKEVYRLNTAGGAAPKTCEGLVGTSFQKEYSAEYWFWH